MEFFKYSGSGNIFLVIENLKFAFPKSAPLVKALAKEFECDGLLLVEPSDVAPFKMEIINADGTIPNMCGNGLRCIVDHLVRRGKLAADSTIETRSGLFEVHWSEMGVEIEMPRAENVTWDISLDIEGQCISGHYLVVGVPHFVITKSVRDFEKVAPLIRHHERFLPYGCNVNLALGGEVITYERGVEGITGACGTGVVASYVALNRKEKEPLPLTLFPKSGEPLSVRMNEGKLFLKGGATLLFKGDLPSYIMGDVQTFKKIV